MRERGREGEGERGKEGEREREKATFTSHDERVTRPLRKWLFISIQTAAHTHAHIAKKTPPERRKLAALSCS